MKWALGLPPSDERLTTYVEPLPEAIRDRLASFVIKAENELQQLIEDLDLQPTEVSITRLLLAHLVLGSNNVVEAKTPYLKSSGPVPSELAVYLNPRLEKLDRLLAEACSLITATWPRKGAQPKNQRASKPGNRTRIEGQP